MTASFEYRPVEWLTAGAVGDTLVVPYNELPELDGRVECVIVAAGPRTPGLGGARPGLPRGGAG